MGNMINPVGFRLGVNKVASAHWYADPSDYPRLLQEDELIRETVVKDVGHSGIARIDIERAARHDLLQHAADRPSRRPGQPERAAVVGGGRLDDQTRTGTGAVEVRVRRLVLARHPVRCLGRGGQEGP